MDGSEPVVLQPLRRAEPTISGGGNNWRITVTLEQSVSGTRKLTDWCWRLVRRFTPTINDENVVCLVKKVDGTACNHLKWTPSEGKRGTGTSGMTTHIQNSCQAERIFQRSSTSLVTCAATCLQVRSSA